MKKILLPVFALLCLVACGGVRDSWTDAEEALIMQGSDLMRVLQVTDAADAVVLRGQVADIPKALIGGDVWLRLSDRMLATVQDESNPGVGIAGPQVGISRRVVAVQRFDKAGEPFEVYPNIRIVAFRGDREPGPEGCLSVPDRRGDVLRWQDIDIQYTSPKTLADTSETVKGFTAVIFQHECDHLDGIIFTDRIAEQEESKCVADDGRTCTNN